MMSFSKAIDPDHDISDHHYFDNCTLSVQSIPTIAPIMAAMSFAKLMYCTAVA